MKKKNFVFKAKVWRWPGDMGWYFVNVPKEISENIRKAYPKGFVKILATIGAVTWETSLFPHKQSGAYLLSIKTQVRKKEDIWEGDGVSVAFNIK